VLRAAGPLVPLRHAHAVARRRVSPGTMRRITSTDISQHHVDTYLASVRMRGMDEVLAHIDEELCSSMSLARATRAGGIIARLFLNLAYAMRSTSLKPTWHMTRSRLLALSELAHLALRINVVARQLVPMMMHAPTFEDWRSASAALDSLRPLASASNLNHITRLKNLVPGTVYLFCSGAGRLGGSGISQCACAAGSSVFRWLAFICCECFAIFLGLLSLHSKVRDVYRKTPHHLILDRRSLGGFAFSILPWIPFLNFANQITGLFDQEDLRMQAVASLVLDDDGAAGTKGNFNAILLKKLCVRHGLLTGIILYLSLTSEDYQMFLISKNGELTPGSRTGRRMICGTQIGLDDMLFGQVWSFLGQLQGRK